MPTSQQIHIEKLKNTLRWKPAVLETAKAFDKVPIKEIEALVQYMIREGEDKALGILLNVIAVNKIKIRPEILTQSLKVVNDIHDFIFTLRICNKTSIQPLLDIAKAEDISWERQALAVRLAAELTLRFNSDRNKVRKTALKLQYQIFAPEARLMNNATLYMLEDPDFKENTIRWYLDLDILHELPEDKPPVVIGGDYTVRRVIAKLGRNAPCHCGSGKKYKHCCYTKDIKLSLDASPYEGITRSQIQVAPDLIDDTAFIEIMRAYELKKLNPKNLNEDQLFAAYKRADLFKLHGLAFNILVELKNRPDKSEFAISHMEDLLHLALIAKDLEMARKIQSHIPDGFLHNLEDVEFQMYLLAHSEPYEKLETRCRTALECETKDQTNSHPLLDLCTSFENIYPALSIIFGRSAVMSQPHRYFDNDIILDIINIGRVELDMEPWDDPIMEYMEWTDREDELFSIQEEQNLKINQLHKQVEDSQKIIKEKIRELHEKEHSLTQVSSKLDKLKPKAPAAAQIKSVSGDPLSLEDLKFKVENLKAEIRNQQKERSLLRYQLKEEKDKLNKNHEEKPAEQEVSNVQYESLPAHILFPHYTPAFRKHCKNFPSIVTASAIRAATGFAVHDKQIWRQTRKIELLNDIYRIRIGMQYRLLLEWKTGVHLKILDIIPRSKLETWIKEHEA